MRQLGFLQITTGCLAPFVGGQISRWSQRQRYYFQGEVATLVVDHEVLYIRFAWLGQQGPRFGEWLDKGHYDGPTKKWWPVQLQPWLEVPCLDTAVRLIDYTVDGPDLRREFRGPDGSFWGFNAAYDGGCIHLTSQITDERLKLFPKVWERAGHAPGKIYRSQVQSSAGLKLRSA